MLAKGLLFESKLERWVGLVLVAYGLAKLSIGTSLQFQPSPGLDHTVAGRVVDVCLMIFGIYTFGHGLGILGSMTPYWNHFFTDMKTTAVVYGIMGVFLIGFFSLVLFTSWVPSSPDHKMTYELIGMLGGELFLFSVVVMAIYHRWVPTPALVVGFVATTAAMVWSTWRIFQEWKKAQKQDQANKGPLHQMTGDLVTLAVIPLNMA